MSVEIEIVLDNVPITLSNILYKSIEPEISKEKHVIIKKENNPLDIKISAQSISRGRAIMNSYLFWIYTILATLKEVDNA